MQLETNRLLLRPWTTSPEDLKYFQTLSSDIGYTAFSPPGTFSPCTPEQAKEKLNAKIKIYEEHQIGKFLIFHEEKQKS